MEVKSFSLFSAVNCLESEVSEEAIQLPMNPSLENFVCSLTGIQDAPYVIGPKSYHPRDGCGLTQDGASAGLINAHHIFHSFKWFVGAEVG